MQGRNSPGRHGIEILVSYGISPFIQFLKQFSSAFVFTVQGVNFHPEFDSQSVEIGPNGAWVWIAFPKTTIPDKFHAQENSNLRRDNGNDLIDAFGMQIPTKTLKMRR